MTIQSIPLNKLEVSARNVRKTGAEDNLDELIASIGAHGLLQSLVVQPGKRGKYAVIAGGRRLRALTALAQSGTIARDMEIPCRLIAKDDDAEELSLAENIVRAPMHPADQFEAFCAVIDQGKSIADVAARFSVSEDLVQRRLKLGRLSPAILQAYRDEMIDLEQAQAFAISDNHAEQEAVLEALGTHAMPHRIRAALTHGEVPSSDRRVRFVGQDAYLAAGGTIRRDLFANEGGYYVTDEALLEKLASEKFALAAEQARAEGWKWVEFDMQADYGTFARFVRHSPRFAKLSPKQQKRLDALSAKYDAMAEELDRASDPDADTRLAEIERKIDALKPAEIWSKKILASCGVILSIDHDGELRVEKGLMTQGDARKAKASARQKGGEASAESLLPATLVEELTAHKTAVIRANLIGNSEVALAVIVHGLLLDLWYRSYRGASCLELSAKSAELGIRDGNPEVEHIEAKRNALAALLPAEEEQLWSWCLAQPAATHLDLLGYLAACMINAVQKKSDRQHASRLLHADALAKALGMDMATWYTPTAEGFFSRISRKQILAVIDEATGSHEPALEKLGKAELAKRAETLVAGRKWLPEPLRLRHDLLAAD